MIFLIILAALFVIVYYLLSRNYQYWSKRGVPGPKPRFFVGNLGQSFLFKRSIGEIFIDIYKEYKNVPMVGVFRATTPTLLVNDPELIKNITVKDFSSFHDNDIDIDKEMDPLFGRNPFVLKGEEWKSVRSQLTPCFTSGKMKVLYPLMEDISKRLVKFIEDQPTTMNGEGYNSKELCTRFTLNNIATCAFGLEGKCFEEDNSQFRQIAHRFLTPTGWATMKMFIIQMLPMLSKFIKIKFTPKDVEEELISLVTETMRYRQENNIVRNDFLNTMMQLKNTSKDYTDIDVTAHAAGFFGDGFETSSIIMSFFLYELGANPDIQELLRKEILQAYAANKNELPYEALQEMTYLDAALNESLRMHPALFTLFKMCTTDYNYQPTNPKDKAFIIEKGTSIALPVFGLHYDSKYFKEPERFKPERFLAENKDNFTKYAYLPFGEGPRACLGQRFGLLQIKVAVTHIIKNYKISVNTKTKTPFTYDALYFMILPVGGIWLDFTKIE